MDLAKRDKIIELLRSEISKTQDSVVTYLKEAKNVQNERSFKKMNIDFTKAIEFLE